MMQQLNNYLTVPSLAQAAQRIRSGLCEGTYQQAECALRGSRAL